jgi:hypothetical protein
VAEAGKGLEGGGGVSGTCCWVRVLLLWFRMSKAKGFGIGAIDSHGWT